MDTVNYKKYLFILLLCLLLFVLEEVTYNQLQLPVHLLLPRAGVPHSASKSSIRRFVIMEKAPTRAFSWLKAATTAFTFKTLLS